MSTELLTFRIGGLFAPYAEPTALLTPPIPEQPPVGYSHTGNQSSLLSFGSGYELTSWASTRPGNSIDLIPEALYVH